MRVPYSERHCLDTQRTQYEKQKQFSISRRPYGVFSDLRYLLGRPLSVTLAISYSFSPVNMTHVSRIMHHETRLMTRKCSRWKTWLPNGTRDEWCSGVGCGDFNSRVIFVRLVLVMRVCYIDVSCYANRCFLVFFFLVRNVN